MRPALFRALGLLSVVAGLSTPVPVAAQIAYVGSSLASTASSNVSAVTVPKPTSLANGHLMLAIVGDRLGNTGSISAAPSGWTLVQSVAASGQLSLKVYSRWVANAAAEPASYTWTLSSSERASAAILYFSGADATTPVDASAALASAASTTYRAPSVTTTTANTMLVAVYEARNGNVVINPPAGLTEAFNNGASGAGPNGLALAASYATQAAVGVSGNLDSTGNISLINAGLTIAVRRGPVAAVDHYEQSLPTASLSCLPTTVTITACANSSSPCTSAASTVNGATATLATSGATLGTSLITFNASGVATTTLSYPSASNGSTVAVSLSNESSVATHPRQCCPNGSSCTAANSCSSSFSTAGFIFAATVGGASATLPAQTAGTASGSYNLRAVRTASSTQACEAALTGPASVNWAYECNNPGTCAASNLMSVDAGSATTIQRNNNGSVSSSSSTAVTMSFDANGNAPFSFTYGDVGQTTLWINKTVNSATLAGNSNAFVTRPAGFALSAVKQTAAPQLANPAPASDAGAKFVKAGESFGLTVTAQSSTGATTPSFGRETLPEGVQLTPTLQLPAGGAAGTLANATLAGGIFTNGVATLTNLSYSEVGIITLTPAVADGNYLGAGLVSASPSVNIGRFFPAGFALSAASVSHRNALACSPASAFSYLGENFGLGFTLTAQNTAGATTRNYRDGFAKLDLATASALNLAGRDGAVVFDTSAGRLSLGSAAGNWAAGVASGVAITASASRLSTPDGPFNAAFGIAPVDSDGVAMNAFDLASTLGGSNDRAQLGVLPLRFGRLRLSNAIGPADRALALPALAQHWNASAWATNTLDSCTAVAASAVSFGNLRRGLTVADTAVAAGIAVSAGLGSLRLSAPGGGRSGSVDVALSLGATATDASCMQAWTPGSGDAATSAAQLAFLRGAWCSAGYDKDPSARATFGQQSGNLTTVYRRENF